MLSASDMSMFGTAILLLSALTSTPTISQPSTPSVPFSVIVVDARTGVPLPGVLVSVDALTDASVTDGDGRVTLSLSPGPHVLTIGLVGYAVLRQSVDVPTAPGDPLRIALAEGAGGFEERVSVAGSTEQTTDAPSATAVHGRELQALKGLTLDDPLRALHALPSVAATDDFYSEFAVRGLGFRNTGLVVDGIATPFLMHSVHGISDGGSIAMVNSDAVASAALAPGSYPQRFGGRMGAQVDLTLREGTRDGFRARAGLSGTSATFLGEGPLGSRGSWLASVRRSYLDLVLNQIEEDSNLGFGFTDGEAKIVYDLNPRHRLEGLFILGGSKFEEQEDELSPDEAARVTGRSWLSSFGWRYTPSASFMVTQRVYSTGLSFDNVNQASESLDDSRAMDAGWRADAMWGLRPALRVELGGEARRSAGRRTLSRVPDGATSPSALASYDESGSTVSAYGQAVLGPWRRVTLTPGIRADRWSVIDRASASPWITGEVRLDTMTSVRAGAGLYRQAPDIDQVHGLRGGGTSLRPESARHLDVGVARKLPLGTTLHATVFTRDEHDVLWTPGSEPRRLADGTIVPGRSNAPWTNALDGDARGVEVLFRRDVPSGLSGWAGYAYTRLRYTSASTGEQFWSDFDQRHALSLFGYYRLSSRSTVGVKFRYGSNYPRIGYITEVAESASPESPLVPDEGSLGSFGLTDARNGRRLPAYARLDVRTDRTFTWSGRRITLFVEVANVLNRDNVRNVPYGVDRDGRILGGTDTLLPILPSAGFVIEF